MGRRAGAIASRADFQRIFRQGQLVNTPHLSAHVLQSSSPGPGRLAVVVSRKHGGAVERNRIRRRIREAVRLGGGPPRGADTVLVARAGTSSMTYRAVQEEIDQILENINAMWERNP